MGTFRKGHYARTILARTIQIGTVATTPAPSSRITWHIDPSDTLTLRGIPAIGEGVAGAIRGTNPTTLDDIR